VTTINTRRPLSVISKRSENKHKNKTGDWRAERVGIGAQRAIEDMMTTTRRSINRKGEEEDAFVLDETKMTPEDIEALTSMAEREVIRLLNK